jgi:aerobic C4-dicarboxylate transport protein
LRIPLYAQVLAAIVLGVVLGALVPAVATNPWVQLMGTGFVRLIKMVIGPIIFCSIVAGIAHVADAAKVGRVALKALIYFELMSTFALVLGLAIADIVRPGDGFVGHVDGAAVEKYEEAGKNHTAEDFVLDIIPETMIAAFTEGSILQVLFVAILVGFALMNVGEHGKRILNIVEDLGHMMFNVVAMLMKAAPIGAFGAIAYTVGKYGIATLGNLLGLVLLFYATAIVFVFLVLGVVAAVAGFNIFRFLFYIKSELLLVLATSSSECALPSLMDKLTKMGCAESVVGLVVPLGYSFNLDGTNIYMTLATLFISQALGVELSFVEQLKIVAVAMLTSKGAAGVSGAGFITLASTLSAINPELVPGMSIVLGVDKFMSECRALTNLIGNSVATVVIARTEGELDLCAMRQVLLGVADKPASGEGTEDGCEIAHTVDEQV